MYLLFYLGAPLYLSLGCWKDNEVSVIPTLENVSSILDGHPETREYAIEKCAAAAEFFGYQVFALRDGGECLSSENAVDTYYKYEESTNCSSHGKGVENMYNVYQIINGKLQVITKLK